MLSSNAPTKVTAAVKSKIAVFCEKKKFLFLKTSVNYILNKERTVCLLFALVFPKFRAVANNVAVPQYMFAEKITGIQVIYQILLQVIYQL